MAAPKENLLSLGNLIDMERNTFRKQREHSLKKSVNRPMLLQADFSNHPVARSGTMHLLQRWQELKDRELRSQQYNKQLLQQFEEAQDALREMLTLTADMKTIRTEYERYLKESSTRRQQQLKNSQAAQKKLDHLASMPSHYHPWPRQNPADQASLHPDQVCSWTAGTAGTPSGSEGPWVKLYMHGPCAQRGIPQFVGKEAETSSAPSSKRERAGGRRSSHLSQELDTKPVRLSSCPAESSESGRESSQVSKERRKHGEKRGRSRRTSSDTERRSSQGSSQNSSVIVTAAITAAQSSESGVSSEESRTSTWGRKSAGHVGLQRVEKAATERARNKHDDSGSRKEKIQSSSEETSSEKAGDQSQDKNSEGWREESGPESSVKIKNGDEDLCSSSAESSEEQDEEKEHEKCLGEGDEDTDSDDDEDSKTGDEEEERDVEDDGSERNATTEEEEAGAEDEQESEEERDQEEKSDQLKSEMQGSASSQDEDEAGEDKMEEDGESALRSVKTGEEEQKRDEAGQEEDDSEDSIISPQSKKLHVIPEETREDEDEGSKSGNSDEESMFSDEDIEHLLAPQEQKQEKDRNTHSEKPKACGDKLEIFQVETDRKEMDHPSDSDEFDHFYE